MPAQSAVLAPRGADFEKHRDPRTATKRSGRTARAARPSHGTSFLGLPVVRSESWHLTDWFLAAARPPATGALPTAGRAGSYKTMLGAGQRESFMRRRASQPCDGPAMAGEKMIHADGAPPLDAEPRMGQCSGNPFVLGQSAHPFGWPRSQFPMLWDGT